MSTYRNVETMLLTCKLPWHAHCGRSPWRIYLFVWTTSAHEIYQHLLTGSVPFGRWRGKYITTAMQHTSCTYLYSRGEDVDTYRYVLYVRYVPVVRANSLEDLLCGGSVRSIHSTPTPEYEYMYVMMHPSFACSFSLFCTHGHSWTCNEFYEYFTIRRRIIYNYYTAS